MFDSEPTGIYKAWMMHSSRIGVCDGEAMKLLHMKAKFDRWMKRMGERSEDVFRTPSSATEILGANFVQTGIAQERKGRRSASARVIEWRRRVLLKKGARLHVAMVNNADDGSLAMLDACGMVVSWYGAPAAQAKLEPASGVLGHHISQFYLPEDIAKCVPLLDLRTAVTEGICTRRGWRKRANGAVFWSTTEIRAIAFRDGTLQGFSHVIRETNDPWMKANAGAVRQLQQRESEARWLPRDGALGMTLKRASDEGQAD
jgi:hypothetical protein